jgi:hypothetical protein
VKEWFVQEDRCDNEGGDEGGKGRGKKIIND